VNRCVFAERGREGTIDVSDVSSKKLEPDSYNSNCDLKQQLPYQIDRDGCERKEGEEEEQEGEERQDWVGGGRTARKTFYQLDWPDLVVDINVLNVNLPTVTKILEDTTAADDDEGRSHCCHCIGPASRLSRF
jgi:hypothetical protein